MMQNFYFNLFFGALFLFFVGSTFWLFRFDISNVIFAESSNSEYKAEVEPIKKDNTQQTSNKQKDKNEEKQEDKIENKEKTEKETSTEKSKKIDKENAKEIEKESLEKDQNNLPKEYNLAIPFTSQAPEADWSQPWQDACEEATVLMLDAYYKDYNISTLFAKDEIQKIVDWEQEKKWGRSIEVEKIVELIRWYTATEAKVINNPNVEQIKELVAGGSPVFVVAHGKTLDNPYFTDGGPDYHTLIIRGYTDTHFITNDPGTSRGENFKYTYENLMNAIHDYNDGDVEQGEKRVIVLD